MASWPPGLSTRPASRKNAFYCCHHIIKVIFKGQFASIASDKFNLIVILRFYFFSSASFVGVRRYLIRLIAGQKTVHSGWRSCRQTRNHSQEFAFHCLSGITNPKRQTFCGFGKVGARTISSGRIVPISPVNMTAKCC